VLQLAHVPREGVALEDREGLRAHLQRRAVGAREEVLDQERDVLAPLAQWRQHDPDTFRRW